MENSQEIKKRKSKKGSIIDNKVLGGEDDTQ